MFTDNKINRQIKKLKTKLNKHICFILLAKIFLAVLREHFNKKD